MASPYLLNRVASSGSVPFEALTRATQRRGMEQDIKQKDVLFRRGVEDQDALRNAMPGAVAGDPTAIAEVLRRDPAAGMKVMEFTRQGQEKQRERMQQAVMGSAASVIMAEPDARPQAYQQSREALQKHFPGQFDDLPEAYDDKTFLGMVSPMFPPQVMEKIVQDRFKQPEQTANQKDYDFAVKQGYKGTLQDWLKENKGKGMSVTLPDGTIISENGEAPALGATKPTTNALQETLVTSQAGLDRLRGISTQFKPEYQTWEGRLKGGIASLKDKAGVDMAPEEQAMLSDYSGYRASVLDNLNRHIKDITGASMSVQEASRITKSMPSDDDGPTAFKSKLDQTMKNLGRAQARAYYTLAKGLTLDKVGLEQIDDIIRKRGTELEAQVKKSQPDAKAEEVQGTVKQQLMREFGIGQ